MADQPRDIKFYFPTVVQETIIENHADLNRSLMSAISRLRSSTPGTVPSTWSCELYTTLMTNSLLHQNAEFAPLVTIIQDQAERFAKFLKFDLSHYRLTINNCWVNIYGAHHAQDIHVHANSVFSGVYYVKVPKDAPGLLIHSPFSDTMVQVGLVGPSFATTTHHEIEATEGKMVFFRSFVRHAVRPNTVEGERISIAFNLTM